MPVIKKIRNVKILIHSREHPPPHFHAQYVEYEFVVAIEDLKVFKGILPLRQRKNVMDWAEQNQKLLLENFKRLNPEL